MTPALDQLSRVVHQPEVLRWVAPGHVQVDLAHFNEPGCYTFGDDDGLVLYCPIDIPQGIYEMHYLFTDERRGKEALEQIRWACRVMFTEKGATAICGAVPREHRASRIMSRALGAVAVGSHTDHFGRDCIVYSLERRTWGTLLAA